MEQPIQTLKVSNTTEVSSLAFAIHMFSEEGRTTELCCLGVLSVYVAVKAVIYANKLSIASGHAFYVFPQFRQAPALRPKTESERKTLVVFSLKKFSPGGALWEV